MSDEHLVAPQAVMAWSARAGVPAFIVLVTIIAFLPALPGEFLNWDDTAFIVNNTRWQGLSGEHIGWMFTSFEAGHYQPLAWMSLAFDHLLWGLDPRGYHLTNVLLHALNALLLYWIIIALLGVRESIGGRMSAAVGALFFSLHPLRVESVAWITERRQVLATMLLMAALLAYLRHREAGDDRRVWPSLALLTLSLLSDAWGMTFGLILIVLNVWVLQRRPSRELATEVTPFVLLGAAAAVVAILAQRAAGAALGLTDQTLAERLLQAGYGVCFYVVKTIVPLRLSPLYLLEEQREAWEVPAYLVAGTAAVAVTALAVLARRRHPWLFAAWISYLVILSPVSGVAQSGAQAVADRYSYVACLPFAVLAAAGAMELQRARGSRRRILGGAAAATLLVLGVLTWRQATHWQTTLSLWNQAVLADPSNYVALHNRGNARIEQVLRLPAERRAGAESGAALLAAMDDFNRSIDLAPGFGWAYASRGRLNAILGRYAAAVDDFNQAISMVGDDPDVVAQRDRAQAALAKVP